MTLRVSRRTILGLAFAAAGGVSAVAREIHPSSRTALEMNAPVSPYVHQLVELTASEAVRHIREGNLPAEVYASALLTRCEAAARANALSWFDAGQVLERARRVDRSRATGAVPGLLAGLPIIVKDNIDTVGFPTSAGTRLLKDNRPAADAPVARALFRKGAILLAKSNMHELAGGGTSSNPLFGAVGNPYDSTRVAGGSSGGTAAAIALRFTPAGLGTDTAGSVRIPAALCGVAGLRPSTAVPSMRYPEAGIVPLASDLDTAGPLGRSVRDVALLHTAITGVPLPTAPALRGLKVGLPDPLYWAGLDSQVDRVMQEALRKLQDAGVTFVHVDVSAYIEATQRTFGALIMDGIRADLDTYFRQRSIPHTRAEVVAQILSRDTRSLFDTAAAFTPPPGGMRQVRETRRKLLLQYHRVLNDHGVEALCFPTEIVPAPHIRAGGDGPTDALDVEGVQIPEAIALVRNTRPVCALGAPALTLPAGRTRDGLPVGIELEGRAGEDSRLLGLGISFEGVLGRLPPPV
jgi:indoleacetamide hydrolase